MLKMTETAHICALCFSSSGTFKFQKTEMRRDGFDPTAISDRLYLLDSSRGRYTQLDEELYRSILSGKHKL